MVVKLQCTQLPRKNSLGQRFIKCRKKALLKERFCDRNSQFQKTYILHRLKGITKEMEEKRFQKNDNGFICKSCGFEVEPLGVTSRDHCPRCLCSIHVDINPGDRANDCLGILRPVQVLPDPKKGYIIVYKCDKCGATVRNKAAYPAKIQPDDIDLLIKLTVNPEL